jgi:magnesium transporter
VHVRKLELGSAQWVDITDATEAELQRLSREYDLPENVATDCLDPSQLPKVQKLNGHSFIMLRGYDEKSSEHASTAQSLTRKAALLWSDRILLTVHRAPLPWVDEIWNDEDSRKQTPTALVQALVESSLYTYERPIDIAAEHISELEAKIFAERSTKVTSGATLEMAYVVKRRATTFKRLLRLTRDLLPTAFKPTDSHPVRLQALKDEADRLFFYSDDIVESATDLVQLSISMSSNRMNELVRLLTIVSIFLLPLNLVTGIYGMNFEFMPELHKPYAYPLVMGGMFVFELIVYVVLRKRGWIRTGQ